MKQSTDPTTRNLLSIIDHAITANEDVDIFASSWLRAKDLYEKARSIVDDSKLLHVSANDSKLTIRINTLYIRFLDASKHKHLVRGPNVKVKTHPPKPN